jgi:hypothetical protein
MELDNDDPRTAAIRRILEDLRGEYYDLIHHCVDLAENLNVQAEDAKVISQMMAKAVDLITHQEDRIYGLEAFAEESQTMATLQADLHAEQHERRALADRIANLQAVDGSRVDSNGLRLLPAEMEIVKATEAKLDGAVTENRALHAALAEKVKMIEDLEKKLQDKNDSGDYEYKTKECRAMVHQWEQTVEVRTFPRVYFTN